MRTRHSKSRRHKKEWVQQRATEVKSVQFDKAVERYRKAFRGKASVVHEAQASMELQAG
jgi:hypothetical protein